MLVELLKLGGSAALSIGVMYLLYMQLMKLKLFQRMSQTQTFILMMTLLILVFCVVIAALLATGGLKLNFATIQGGGVITQGN